MTPTQAIHQSMAQRVAMGSEAEGQGRQYFQATPGSTYQQAEAYAREHFTSDWLQCAFVAGWNMELWGST